MAITILAVLAALVIKKIAQAVYGDCKAYIWATAIVVTGLAWLLLSGIFEKIALIPVFLLF